MINDNVIITYRDWSFLALFFIVTTMWAVEPDLLTTMVLFMSGASLLDFGKGIE